MYAERNAEEVIRQFESSRERGLSAAVAEERLGGYGLNKLEEQKKEVEAALEEAVEKGRRYGISDEDIRSLFELILEE